MKKLKKTKHTDVLLSLGNQYANLCEIKVKLKTSKVHKQIFLNPNSLKISKLGFSVDYSQRNLGLVTF